MAYVYSFFLYVCLDLCHKFYQIPYSYNTNSGHGKQNLANSYPVVCNYCLTKWDTSPIGNASDYTKFYFFSRENIPNYTEIIFQNNQSLDQSGFNVHKNTKLLIHGWRDAGFRHFPPRVKDVYLAAQDVNVLVVDWSRMSQQSYPLARVAVQPVGTYLAKFLNWLIIQTGVSLSSFHVVGHSLGAHIAGVVGEHVPTGKLSRITGLDPAGPGFSFDKDGRLDPTDAMFVDVIHTSGMWAGYYDPLGTADFYPNGGFPDQPGCTSDWGSCSHGRSYRLFMESITSVGFVARGCSSWFDYTKGECGGAYAVMGEQIDTSARGRFYLYTAGQSPYALGNYTKPLGKS